MKMIGNKIQVRLKNRDEVSKGGIAIPERAQRVEEWGEVVSAGPDCKDLKVGDLVFIGPTQGTHYRDRSGTDYIIVEESKVQAKLEGV